MTLITPARLGLMSALCLVAAAVIAFGDEAQAATGLCDDTAALQQRLTAFDARWNASDAWGLTALFAPDGSVGAEAAAGRQAVYRELVQRLGRATEPRRTRVLRATPVGAACRVDVVVRRGERSEPGLFLLAAAPDGGIVAMR